MTDARLRMDPGALADMVRADRRRGLRPCCVVASVGTTNTGAVDPVAELAEVARPRISGCTSTGPTAGRFS
ncbi:MAG TPA: pyridoxal-dependent decarboxylase [Pseudonocardiaceae bacterium]